jgi:class 3 adenylate cyclase
MLSQIREGIDRRVHDPRIQNRLEVGSSLALAVGLLISASIFFGLLDLSQSTLLGFLNSSAPHAVTDSSFVQQDRLIQILVIFLMALLAGATIPHVRLLTAIGLTLIFFVMYLSYEFRNFDQGILVQPVYPMLALILTSAGTMAFRYFFEERQRAVLGRLFGRQVSPDVLDQIVRTLDDGSLPLRGVRRRATVLYADLREFSALAEPLEPEVTVKLLEEYVTMIVNTVFRFGGSVTMHSGDTVVAVWNLPLDQNDHARRAASAALEIQAQAIALSKVRPEAMEIHIGIGIGTGSVVAGHIGASTRGQYTILGEVVGMAERMAMKPDRGIFVNAEARDMIGDDFDTQEVNPVRLRRQTDPILVWEVHPPMQIEEETEAEQKVEPAEMPTR